MWSGPSTRSSSKSRVPSNIDGPALASVAESCAMWKWCSTRVTRNRKASEFGGCKDLRKAQD